MSTRIDWIAEDIHRISTFVPEIAAPAGFTFNQYLIEADQPLLFHCGPRAMFPAVKAALETVMPAGTAWFSSLADRRPIARPMRWKSSTFASTN